MDNLLNFTDKMKALNIDAYLITTTDYHMSNFTAEYFHVMNFLINFSKKNAKLVITKEYSYLFIDTKYYQEALEKVNTKIIKIIKEDESDETFEEFLGNLLKDNETFAFDSKSVSTSLIESIRRQISSSIKIISEIDLANTIWNNRPELPFSLVYELDPYFSGITYSDKITMVREKIKKYNSEAFVLSNLSSQAWLYNLRGNDIVNNPLFLSYTIIENDKVTLFIDERKIDNDVEKYLEENNVDIKPYNDFYTYLSTIKAKKVLIDKKNTSYKISSTLKSVGNVIINIDDPIILLKAIKNETEIKNIKNAYIKDGVIYVKSLYNIKQSYISSEQFSELSIADLIDGKRREVEGFVDSARKTNVSFNQNTGSPSYRPTIETSSVFKDNGTILIDFATHYLNGTTKLARTVSLGKTPDLLKTYYTTVLKANIDLSKEIFIKGLKGFNLDIIVKTPIWSLGLDYKNETGYGVDYLASLNEGPNIISYKDLGASVIYPNMVTVIEPGIYIENKYGVKLSSSLLCVKNDEANDNFNTFENITIAPFERDLIKTSLLTKDEKEWLNKYHEKVYNTLEKYLTNDEKEFLKHLCEKI